MAYIIDTECYRNYWLFAVLNTDTGNVKMVDFYPGQTLDVEAIKSVMNKRLTVSFNGNGYDLPMIAAAVGGYSTDRLKTLSDSIIQSNLPAWKVTKQNNIKIPDRWDHVDIIEVAPGKASLKIYAGRLNARKMQDLPIDPDETISPEQRELLRKYCVNDLENTALLYNALRGQLNLRKAMSTQYGLDLRSKSDAQIAECVISSEIHNITGDTYYAQTIPAGYWFYYNDPDIIRFKTKPLKAIFQRILATKFELSDTGSVSLPAWLSDERIVIGENEYQMGIGGLHSTEKCQCYRSNDEYALSDFDVVSYYPSIILQQQIAPKAMGEHFLNVYQSIVDQRIYAKKRVGELEKILGDLPVGADTTTIDEEYLRYKTEMDSKKLSINGSFGKLGSKYSPLYSPELLLQTTLTGQLALLMLIERVELAGMKVISANTDGIVIYYHRHKDIDALEQLTWDWMLDTSYELERTDYRLLASRDVNNYCAVKLNGSVKGKGCFAEPSLAKNPDGYISYAAVKAHLASGVDLGDYIRTCRDITQFVTVRRVTGGAVWPTGYTQVDDWVCLQRGVWSRQVWLDTGVKKTVKRVSRPASVTEMVDPTYLGKAIRYYKSTHVPAEITIHYANNGNRVPNSDGCRPMMDMPDSFPDDIDYAYYINKAEELLKEIGYYAD